MKKCLLLISLVFFLSFVICEELPAPDDWSDVNLSDNVSTPDDWSDVNFSNESLSDSWGEVNLSNEELVNSSFQSEDSPGDLEKETVSSTKYNNINKKIVNLVTTGNIYGVKTGAYYFALVMGGIFLFVLALLVYLVFFKH